MKYAYWRRPDTRPHKADDDSHAPTALLEEIGMKATVHPDGSISWPMTNMLEMELAAESSITVLQPDGAELNEMDSNALVDEAIHQLIRLGGGHKPINPKKLLDLVNRNAKSFFNRPMEERLLVTSLSVEKCDAFPIEVFGSQINAADRRKFPFPPPLLARPSFVSPHVKSTKYAVVSVNTKEITLHQAFDRGMTAINCLRGVWNLLATFCGSGMSWSVVPQRKWIGEIHVGPVHAFYNADGATLTDWYWYEPDYVEDGKLFKPKKGWHEFEVDRKWIFDKVEASPFKTDLIRLFARYAIALDQSNLDVSFLMLWSLLEKITNTVGANYDETIKRAIWPFSDRAVSQQLLNQMRMRRNQFVHSAVSSSARDQLCYITKSFVDNHLELLVQNPYSVNSLQEYGEFLALPHDTGRLEQLLGWYKRALDMKTKPSVEEIEVASDKDPMPEESQ